MNSVTNQVVISGIGCLSTIGKSYPETMQGLFSTPVNPCRPQRFKTTLDLPVFELTDLSINFDVPGGFTLAILRYALEEALDSARLTKSDLTNLRVGVCLGTTVACQLNNLPFYAKLRKGEDVSSEPLQDFVEGCPAEWVHRSYGLKGPAITVSNACTSSADAIGIAMLWIQQGVCDLVIAGGADELNQVPLDGFHALGVCSTLPCRPFDVNREGLNLGEGAGIVILENIKSAKGRKINPQFELPGFGKGADAFHITKPHPDGTGLKRAIDMALMMAKILPEDVTFINAHGTGTIANDKIEANTLVEIFGSGLKYMSTKSLTGHTLGAAGVLELIFCCAMLDRNCVLKSHGFENLPADISSPPVTKNTPINGGIALSTSLAFGGSNTAILVKKYRI